MRTILSGIPAMVPIQNPQVILSETECFNFSGIQFLDVTAYIF
jgi:hypothetical protein